MKRSLLQQTRALLVAAGILSALAGISCRRQASPAESERRPAIDVAAVRVRAEAGDVTAQAELGEAFLQGAQLDYKAAARWLRPAAESGHAGAQNNLAMLYEVGQGLAADESEAARWYRKAADQGHTDAQYNLGLLYATGRGVTKDKPESVKWLSKAAGQGLAMAQFNLAQRHEHGQGTVTNLAEAWFWYSLAAEGGIPDARAARDVVGRGLTMAELRPLRERVRAFARTVSRTE